MGSPVIVASLSRIFYTVQTGLALQRSLQDPGLSTGPWVPPQWPASQSATLTLTAPDPYTGNTTAYVFDCIPRAEHEREVVMTQNPIQTSAAVTDHAYVLPARVVVEIGMSDSMVSFVTGQFASNASRSVSAYQTLKLLQQQRLPMMLRTRLDTYDRMMITDIRAPETAETRYAMKAYVTFQELLTAQLDTTAATNVPVSVLPQTTNRTLEGQIQPSQVPSTIQQQDSILNTPGAGINLSTVPVVPGAGTYTSTGLGNLGQMLSGLGG